MNITYDQEPAGFCPVQAEGFINGLPFYFRSRGSRWALHVARTPDGDPLDKDALFHGEDYPSEDENAASYANPEECKQFIEKAAAILITIRA